MEKLFFPRKLAKMICSKCQILKRAWFWHVVSQIEITHSMPCAVCLAMSIKTITSNLASFT